MTHQFLLEPFVWIGEGKINFQASKDVVHFFTKWTPVNLTPQELTFLQEVELHGLQQTTRNLFTFQLFKHGHLNVILENDLMGKVTGKGIYNDKTIAWELRDQPGTEGFEVYELQESGEYHFKAEYTAGDLFHTYIEGRIWKKVD